MGKPSSNRDTPALDIRLLGPIEVWNNGQRMPLPRSRKTRALLGYLVSSERHHSRDRLCNLLWDATDDPRAALRWSLSKLRSVLEGPNTHIATDREQVRFVGKGATVDAITLLSAAANGLAEASTAELESLAKLSQGEFLEGLDLPDLFEFQAWCIARREEIRQARCAVCSHLTERLANDPERALPYARAWADADAFGLRPRQRLLEVLVSQGRRNEAQQQYELGRRLLLQANPSEVPEFDSSWRSLSAVPTVAVAPPAIEPSRKDGPAWSPQEAAAGATPFVGRREESDKLERLLGEAVRQERQGMALVTAEPGAGKTRLAIELAAQARKFGIKVLTTRCYEGEGSRAFGPWSDALGPEVSRLIDGSRDHQPSSRDEFFEAVAASVARHASSNRGALLIVDDLQWIDSDSAELLHFTARSTRDCPLFVLLLARAGELSDNEAASRAIRSLRREAQIDSVDLKPLSAADIQTIVSPYAGAVGDAIYTASSGNPLFALELARAAGAGDDASGSSVVRLIRERVDRLPPAAGEVLRWGAVLGHVLDVDRLQALTNLPLEDLVDALERLEGHALLRPELEGDGNRYTFAHDVVREAIYGGLSHPRRRLMHRQVARLLQDRATDPATATEVAHHAGLAGEAILGVRSCIAAGLQALRIFANGEAETLALRGLDLVGGLENSDRVAATLELLHIQYSARTPNREQAAIRVHELAVQALDLGLNRPARLGFQMLSFLRWESASMADAYSNIEQAERVSRSADPGERAAALAHAARCLVLLERNMGQAEAFLIEANALATRGEHSTSAASFATAMLHEHRGELDEAATAFREARWQARQNGDRLAEFAAMEHWTMLEIDRERFDEAIALATELVALGGRVRAGAEDPSGRALLALAKNLRGIHEENGDLPAAIDDLRLADAKYQLTFLMTRLARIDLAAGNIDAAREHAKSGLAFATAIGRPSDVALSRILLARCEMQGGASALPADVLQDLQDLRGLELSIGVRDELERVIRRA